MVVLSFVRVRARFLESSFAGSMPHTLNSLPVLSDRFGSRCRQRCSRCARGQRRRGRCPRRHHRVPQTRMCALLLINTRARHRCISARMWYARTCMSVHPTAQVLPHMTDTHIDTCAHTHTLTHSLTHARPHSNTPTPLLLTHSATHPLALSLTLLLAHSLTPAHYTNTHTATARPHELC